MRHPPRGPDRRVHDPGAGLAQLLGKGRWVSSYDRATHTTPGGVEVDHTVALAEAWASGARTWTPERRRAFGNDTDLPAALNATTTAVNQVKVAKDIAEWLPPAASAHCRYATDWLQVKYKWGLTVDPAEKTALTGLLRGCGDTPVEVPTRA